MVSFVTGLEETPRLITIRRTDHMVQMFREPTNKIEPWCVAGKNRYTISNVIVASKHTI